MMSNRRTLYSCIFIRRTMAFNESNAELMTTAKANHLQFLNEYDVSSPDRLLRRENYICMTPTSVTPLESEVGIDLIPDLDGIVLENRTLSGVKMDVRYFQFMPNAKKSLLPVYGVLKKHLPLVKYQEESLNLLRSAYGIQLFGSRGWQTFLTILPEEGFKSRNYKACYQQMQFDWFSYLKSEITKLLLALSDHDLGRDTVKKNAIRDVSRWTICPADQHWFLDLVDRALRGATFTEGFKILIFSHRFGERSHKKHALANEFDVRTIDRISIHSAVTIDGSYLGLNLLWAKNGVQQLIGNRGTIWKSLTFSESCNFQSNLDGKHLDISGVMRKLSNDPSCLQFIQFYADTCHSRPKGKYHPVSGSICCCGILHPNSEDALTRSAREYLMMMHENSDKIVFPIRARVEIVTLTDVVPMIIDPTRYFNTDQLSFILRRYPMLIPIKEYVSEKSFCQSLRHICRSLTTELGDLYRIGKQMGGSLASWRSFQLECALEELFLGGTMCRVTRPYSSVLVSKALGFLTMEPANATSTDDCSLPPLAIWTTDVTNQNRIRALSGTCNYLKASPATLGSQAVNLLLKDLLDDKRFNRGRQFLTITTLLESLRHGHLPTWARYAGTCRKDDLVTNLLSATYRYPMTFGRLLNMLPHVNPVSTISLGISALGLNYFPALRFTDSSKNANVHWCGLGLWRLTSAGAHTVFDTQLMTQEICRVLATKELMFTSKLATFNEMEVEFPWVSPIARRLEGLQISETDRTDVLVYCSCVAFIMQGVFVHYTKMANLPVPIPIARLQELQILGQSRISGLNITNVYRLHTDIQYKIDMRDCRSRSKKIDMDHPQPMDSALDIIQDEDPQEFEKEDNIIASAQCQVTWSPQELIILHDLIAENAHTRWKAIYRNYIDRCKSIGMQIRSYNSFKAKIKRVKRV